MIPDEVVTVLREEKRKYEGTLEDCLCNNEDKDRIFYQRKLDALQSAILLIQDYQKLRERVSVGKISQVTIDLVEDNFPKCECKERGKAIVLHAQMLMAIVTYLQQPTEKER